MEENAENAPLLMHCPECGKALDVSGLAPYAKIECPHCAAVIRVRTTMGQYEITGPLGEGGMSQVFRALDRNLGREVALKILHQSLSRDEALIAMFEREAKLTASIVHPNVVKVYTVGRDHGYLFIAMELLQAISLEQLIANKGALSESEVLGIALDVARGLNAAHGEQLIHRDIKPGNMLVTGEGTTKLVDFGLALQQGGEDLSEDLWATPFYVPPEKLDGLPDTFLGDIYSLGATLYHALAGKPPFDANTSSMDELKAIKKNTVDLKSAAPGLSRPTIRLVEKMMAYLPGDRVNSYEELIAQIEAVRRRQFGIEETGRGRSKKKRVKAMLAGGAFVLLAAAAAIVFAISGQGTEDEGDLTLGGGDRVISVGDQTISGIFQSAREQFAAGRFREAEENFTRLVGDQSVPASTRIWSHFFRGTIQLFKGEETLARESFHFVLDLNPEAEAGNLEAINFLKRAAGTLSDPLPVLSDEANFSPDSIEALGLLAAGLKNWQAGQFPSGADLLQRFSTAQVPVELHWLALLQGTVKPFLEDWALLQALPNPTAGATDLATQSEALKKAGESLRTRGAAPRLVKHRIQRIGEIEDLAKKAATPDPEDEPAVAVVSDANANPVMPATTPATVGNGAPTPEELAEIERLKTVLVSLQSYADTLLFSGAALQLQGQAFETPLVASIRDELVHGCEQATKYPARLAEGFTLKSYEGVIRRRTGKPLEATVTKASAEAITIDLGFGPNEVDLGEFAPDWLVEAGLQVLPPVTASTAGDWESLIYFGLFTGQAPLVAAKADELTAADPDFAKRWALVQRLR
jgi:serine/threonine protein kinase